MTDPQTNPTPIGTDQVTILEAISGSATKRITPSEVKGYRVGKFFNITQASVNSIHDLFNVLKALQKEDKKFIIRGRPLGASRNHVVRRSTGEDATFADIPIHWACVDVDGVGEVTGPPRAELTDLVTRCPQLQGVKCIAQVSSSWGIKPGVRAHLWYWLDEPRTSRQVSEWASALSFKVDGALYNPVQPHYTADPEFIGCPDPLEGAERVFMIDGYHDSLHVPSGQAESEVRYWVEKITKLEDDEPRHNVINRAGYLLGGWVGAGVYGADELLDILLGACEDSGMFEADRLIAAKEEIKRAIHDGSQKPRNFEDWRNSMIRTKEGAIKPIPENLTQIFKTHSAVHKCFGFDIRTQQTMMVKRPPWGAADEYPRTVSDADDIEATAWVNRVGIHTSSTSLVNQAITAAAAANPFDRVVDWIKELPEWDRQSRLDEWLPKIVGCQETVYHRAVGAKFIIALIARALHPGCKVDDMVVFVGPQGARKSTLLSEIVGGPGPWAFSDCLGDIRSPRDYIPSLMGPWLIEVAELASFNRKEVEAVKKFLSTRADRYRMPYGRRAVETPRRGIVAGTSNNTSFLSDITGNRRFWPVDVLDINLDIFRSRRDQIFAEALHRFKNGAIWHLEGEEVEEAIEEQERHRSFDPWEEIIRQYCDGQPDETDLDAIAESFRLEVNLNDLLTDVLRIPAAQVHTGHYRRAGAVLRSMGWTKHRINKGRARYWIYKRPVSVPAEDEMKERF